MINIKAKLKELGVSLSEFSNKLKISRPTLASYIEMYESNKKIPKEKYQVIFDELFSTNINDLDMFMNILNQYSTELEKEKFLESLPLEKEKNTIINNLINKMRKDMKLPDYDENVYIFIGMLISSYRKEVIFKQLSEYFVVLNGKKPANDLSEKEKIYISNYYKLFHNDKKHNLSFDKEYWDKFLKRVDDIRVREIERRTILEKNIRAKIDTSIKELLDSGIDLKDININQIFKNIKLD